MTIFPTCRRLTLALLSRAFAARRRSRERVRLVRRRASCCKPGSTSRRSSASTSCLPRSRRIAQARFLKGLIFADQGNAKDAIDMFLQLTEDYPDLPEPYNNLAVIYASQGQYDKARGALEQSIRTHPELCHRVRESRRRVRQAREPGLRQGAADRLGECRRRKNKLALVRDLVGRGGRVAGRPPRRSPSRLRARRPNPSRRRRRRNPRRRPSQARSKAAPRQPPNQARARRDRRRRRRARGGERLGEGLVVEERRCLPRASMPRTSRPPGGEARADWEKRAASASARPRSSPSRSSAPKVTPERRQRRRSVTFRQSYSSDVAQAAPRHQDAACWRKVDGRWLIQQERVGN